jgi:hypothetical protein
VWVSERIGKFYGAARVRCGNGASVSVCRLA